MQNDQLVKYNPQGVAFFTQSFKKLDQVYSFSKGIRLLSLQQLIGEQVILTDLKTMLLFSQLHNFLLSPLLLYPIPILSILNKHCENHSLLSPSSPVTARATRVSNTSSSEHLLTNVRTPSETSLFSKHIQNMFRIYREPAMDTNYISPFQL